MWLFTRYGFFSVACARQDGGRSSRSDPNLMMIRARQRGHLQSLMERFPALAGSQIQANAGTDYPYRILVAKAVWKPVMAELADEQTWSNFKDEAERYRGTENREYIDALHRVWSLMSSLQARERS